MTRCNQNIIQHSITNAVPPARGGFLRRIYRYLKLFTYSRGRSAHLKRFLERVRGRQSRILLSENDYYRLLAMLRKKDSASASKRAKLRYLLRKIDLRPFRLVPNDVITMNSSFVILSSRGTKYKLQLVYPDSADKAQGQISILSWLGMCLLGKRKGDRIGNTLSVGDILYQPENSGHYHL
ncbi:MAG TPA: GreA/GreB family elongation factor [Anaerohalosphaeraceae bacterium]|nr:GreA/GreB family elongation factor [Anaerohalosphaeraceae bacterium]HOL32745.1 GreA/GreB family elongation factor [Anaerohalosphaeraceae bacterium]HOM77208.1 GreA/GreB family elongation factor [Anaerohalosphaeraceae bacterium]HPC65515.1 GreA/GreB family elongation factor [Anaerohalosphaeraceae bacterium]HRS72615.1 GreA/GreB family elongation factor [Anaerohalosphaeraceae bacterium]